MRNFTNQAARVATAIALTTVWIVAAPQPVAAAINPANYTTRTAFISIADDGSGAATATCPSGFRAMTGGAYWLPQGLYNDETLYLLDAHLRSSAATADGSGWYATGANMSGQPLNLIVTVQCLPKSALGTFMMKTREVTVDPGRSGNADLRCKSGQVPINGGGAWHKPGATPKAGLRGFLTTSRPAISSASWLVAGRNEGSIALVLQVRVLCVSQTSVTGCCDVQSSSSFTDYPAMVKKIMSCGSRLALTGGWSWDYDSKSGNLPRDVNTDSRSHVQSSALMDNGHVWYSAGAMTDIWVLEAEFHATVVCAGP